MSVTNVADIVKGGRDSTGAPIETVYAKVVPMYAVYRTSERVVVQYADDPVLARDQRQALIASNPLKGEINGLIDGWRKGPSESALARARLFDRRVADALVVGLQGDQTHAVDLLNQIKTDLLAERTSIARTSYLFTSCAVTLVFAMIFGRLHSEAAGGIGAATPVAGAVLAGVGMTSVFKAGLYMSAAIGALGAFFSIAMAIRSRQIGTDLQWRDNHADAGLRVTIGVISGAVLYCLLHAKIVSFGFSPGAPPGTGEAAKGTPDVMGAFNLIVAFVAGFTERLVGDLLGKVVIGTSTASGNPLAGTTSSAAPVSQPVNKAISNEANPLGRTTLVAAGALANAAVAEAGPPDPDDRLEGCLDHVSLGADDLTRDVELPEATGGVAGRP